MIYKAKSYDHLYGTRGFSDELLKTHFTLYQAYVKNTNQLMEAMEKLFQQGSEDLPQYAELKRRFGWEFNGMRLHEYYFENIRKNPSEEMIHSSLKEKMNADFGSYESWKEDFQAVGKIRGIGWAILAYDEAGDRLLNLWINEHDLGHCAGLAVVLVMDVFEHAYIQDYGIKKGDYIHAFFNVIHWQEVIRRFQDASAMAPLHSHGGHEMTA